MNLYSPSESLSDPHELMFRLLHYCDQMGLDIAKICNSPRLGLDAERCSGSDLLAVFMLLSELKGKSFNPFTGKVVSEGILRLTSLEDIEVRIGCRFDVTVPL